MQDIDYETFLNIRFVSHYTGLSAATILTALKAGLFPSSVQFEDNAVWLSSDIANWLEASPHSPSNFAWGKAA
jgi:predicted DNA-binding transcriptional regulator AlpA